MDLKEKAARGGIWFAAISTLAQAISWIFTFYVIRLLEPKDYGLMTMAAFLTAYLQMFSGLGLGSSIVQRETIQERELSSVFWFSLAFGVVMAAIAFGLAWPTAWLFEDERLVPVTHLISVLFIISALTLVPQNLMTREFDLKKIAMINVVAVIVSSSISVWMAWHGYGVFTLIWANIILNSTKMVLMFVASRWWPRHGYSHREVRPHLSYGLYVAFSGAAMRLFQSLDKFVIGKLFGPYELGLYGNAMTIASMPIDKISPLYQQVTFPLLSRLQGNPVECYKSYLEIARHYLLIIAPLYLGSMVVASELIRVGLGEKWAAMAPLFQVFCLVKLCEALTSYRTVLFNATGRHKNVFWFNIALVVAVPLAIFIAARHSFSAVMWPWLILYPLVCVFWLLHGLRSASLSVSAYLGALFEGSKAALSMAAVLWLLRRYYLVDAVASPSARLAILIIVGAVLFSAFLLLFQRDLVHQALGLLLRRGRSGPAMSVSEA